jgi:drug/metabolite transporter (DMT)-like permease
MTNRAVARSDILALVLAATCWGVGTVVSKAALEEFAPLTLLAVQLASSLAVLALLMRRQGVALRGGGPVLLGRLGLLNPGAAYALSLIGLVTISASLSVLLWALEPLLILFLAGLFLREAITPRLVLLSLIAFAGMVLVVYEPASSGRLIGVALTVAGVVCCAVYTVVTRRFIPDATETSQVVLSQQAHAFGLALVLVVVAGLAGGSMVPRDVTAIGLASAIGSGVLYYAGAYWFYLGALRHVPASVAASSFYLIPIVGVGAGALLLGERLAPQQWLGAIVVLVALFGIVMRSPEVRSADVEVVAASPSRPAEAIHPPTRG